MDGLEIVSDGGHRRSAGVGELLSRIWLLLSSNVGIYLKLAAAPVGVLAVLEGGLFWELHRLGMFPAQPGAQTSAHAQQGAWIMFLGILVVTPLVMAAYAVYEGAACSAALAEMCGSRMTFREAYEEAGRRAWRLIGIMFLRMAAVMLPFVAAMLVIVVCFGLIAMKGSTPHPGLYFVIWPLVIVLYVGGFVWAFWISLHLMLAAPACMAEDLSAWSALKRSGKLSRGGKWRMLGVFIIVCLMMSAAVFAFEMIVFALLGVGTLASMVLHVHPAVPHSTAWIVPASIAAAAVFYLMIALQWGSYAVTMTVLYDDQRFRAEGVAPAPLAGEPA